MYVYYIREPRKKLPKKISVSVFINLFTYHIYIYIHTYIIYTLRVCLSAEGAKNVSWPWLSPLRGWDSLTMASAGKFVYMAHHFILLRLNPYMYIYVYT